ncbi:hypothetical protein AMJ57_00445 [Parcubacteria bacterium SG8_24]|nr:MAG: hypothetical protein AMJ57_00445 [Parcubacteria bacterium SG8_24]
MPFLYQINYFITAFLAFLVGLLVFSRRPRDTIARAFMFFTVSIASWVLTLYFFYLLTDAAAVILVGRLNFAVTTLLAYSAFIFSYLFPRKTFRIPSGVQFALGLFTFVLFAVTMTSDLVSNNEIIRGLDRITLFGPLYPYWAAHFIIFSVSAMVITVLKLSFCRPSCLSGRERQQAGAFLFAFIWGIAFGTLTNIILPFIYGEYAMQHWGPLSGLIFVLITAYAVAKYELLNIKILASETLIAGLLLFFVVDMAFSATTHELIYEMTTFVFVVVLSVLLIHSLRKEAVRMEKLQVVTDKYRRANERLVDLDAAKNEFISIASHQLRTPVSVMKGYLSLMRDGAYGEIGGSMRDKVDQMYEMNQRLVRMINNMLNLSRIERGGLDIELEPTDLLKVIDTVMEELSFKAKQREVDLNFVRPEDDPPKVLVDEEKLIEVLSNVIDNSLKFTPKGKITVRLQVDEDRKHVKLYIEDTGIGMNAREAKNAFKRHYRARTSRKITGETGTGLGLYITHTFLKRMGGDISVVKTAPGKGTTMVIMLPAANRIPRGK